MTIQLNAEDQQRLDRLVALGKFDSLQEAVHACIEAAEPLFAAPPDPGWLEYLEASIDEGLKSAAEGPLIPAEEVLLDLRTRHGRTA